MTSVYDRLGGLYDLLSGPWEGPVRRAALGMLDVQPGQKVLDLGAGTGTALPALALGCGPAGLAVGLDLSPAMLRAAGRRLRRRDLPGRPALLRGDARRLPLAAASFDAALMSFTLELFDEATIPQVLGGLRRVVRPGGRLAVVALTAAGPRARLRELYVAAHRRFPRWLDCRPIDAPGWLEQGGWRVLAVERRSVGGLPADAVLARRG